MGSMLKGGFGALLVAAVIVVINCSEEGTPSPSLWCCCCSKGKGCGECPPANGCSSKTCDGDCPTTKTLRGDCCTDVATSNQCPNAPHSPGNNAQDASLALAKGLRTAELVMSSHEELGESSNLSPDDDVTARLLGNLQRAEEIVSKRPQGAK